MGIKITLPADVHFEDIVISLEKHTYTPHIFVRGQISVEGRNVTDTGFQLIHLLSYESRVKLDEFVKSFMKQDLSTIFTEMKLLPGVDINVDENGDHV